MGWMLNQRYTNRTEMDIEQLLEGIEELDVQSQIDRLQQVIAELEKLVS